MIFVEVVVICSSLSQRGWMLTWIFIRPTERQKISPSSVSHYFVEITPHGFIRGPKKISTIMQSLATVALHLSPSRVSNFSWVFSLVLIALTCWASWYPLSIRSTDQLSGYLVARRLVSQLLSSYFISTPLWKSRFPCQRLAWGLSIIVKTSCLFSCSWDNTIGGWYTYIWVM